MREDVFKQIQMLHHVANDALMYQPITEVLQNALDKAATILAADRLSAIGFNLEHKIINYFLVSGEGRQNVVTSVAYDELWEGLSGWVLRGGHAALSPKAVPDTRESPEVQARRRATNCGSILVVPIKNNDKFLGTITAINRPEQRDFDESDLESLTTLALSFAVLIRNAELIAELQLARDVVQVSRDQLFEQNAMKDKLFSILAHDLRGPVGSLNALLNLVEESDMSIEELREVIGVAQQSSAQTYALLDNLLSWVRAQMDEVKVLQNRFVVAKSLASVEGWIESQAKAKEITLVIECPQEMTITADERMFETIVRNLISNAVKYSPLKSTVIIRGKYKEVSVVIEVEDHGQGIVPEKLKELFGRHSVDSETGTAGERGSGLGLMFCADLARAMGGSIAATSVVSEGSLFRLVLPDLLDGEL